MRNLQEPLHGDPYRPYNGRDRSIHHDSRKATSMWRDPGERTYGTRETLQNDLWNPSHHREFHRPHDPLHQHEYGYHRRDDFRLRDTPPLMDSDALHPREAVYGRGHHPRDPRDNFLPVNVRDTHNSRYVGDRPPQDYPKPSAHAATDLYDTCMDDSRPQDLSPGPAIGAHFHVDRERGSHSLYPPGRYSPIPPDHTYAYTREGGPSGLFQQTDINERRRFPPSHDDPAGARGYRNQYGQWGRYQDSRRDRINDIDAPFLDPSHDAPALRMYAHEDRSGGSDAQGNRNRSAASATVAQPHTKAADTPEAPQTPSLQDHLRHRCFPSDTDLCCTDFCYPMTHPTLALMFLSLHVSYFPPRFLFSV
jgi:hypothetical protein